MCVKLLKTISQVISKSTISFNTFNTPMSSLGRLVSALTGDTLHDISTYLSTR